MVTKLDGARTRFLPFNRGSDPGAIRCGAGNPQHPSGYPTGYLWQEVLERERFLGVLGSYVFTEKREKRRWKSSGGTRIERRETVIFPRYHQLDSVSKLVTAARKEGPGHNYLIQHSAGSGKTNSISWLSHRLATLHTEADEKVFDCVVVITDRRVLDRQTPGSHLPDRARTGRGQGDRPRLAAVGRGAGGRNDDSDHHDTEVPVRDARPAVHRRRGLARRAIRIGG